MIDVIEEWLGRFIRQLIGERLLEEVADIEPDQNTPLWMRLALGAGFLLCMGVIMKGGI